MKGIGLRYYFFITTTVAAATACGVALGGLDPVSGSWIGSLCLSLAAVIFVAACSINLMESWFLRIPLIALVVSIASTYWWYSVVHSGNYRNSMPTTIVFYLDLFYHTVLSTFWLIVERFVISVDRDSPPSEP